MPIIPETPWHRQSFERWRDEYLPQLLAERLPLSGYQTNATGPYSFSVKVSLAILWTLF